MAVLPLPLAIPLPGLELASPFRAVQLAAAIRWDIFDSILDELTAYRAQARAVRRTERQGTHRTVPLLREALEAPVPTHSPRTGRPAWPLHCILAAFLLRFSQRVEDTVTNVHFLLTQNAAFAAACGFAFPKVPSYRCLARFDAEMRHLGLWTRVRLAAVNLNLEAGLIEPGPVVILDTTHIEAEAVVGKTQAGPDDTRVPTDEHAGVLAKSRSRCFLAHKAGMVAFPGCPAPLTAVDFAGATADSLTLQPLLVTFKQEFPSLASLVDSVLADGIYQTEANRLAVPEILGPAARLVAPINPRRTKPKPLDRRGMNCLNPSGVPVCVSGHTLVLQGRDLKTEDYIWRCPALESPNPDAAVRCDSCSDGTLGGRTVRTPREMSPQINWELPQPGAAFKKLYGLRPRIEGSFGILSEVFLIRRLHQRGAAAGQAHLDRTLASMHLWLYARRVLADRGLPLAA